MATVRNREACQPGAIVFARIGGWTGKLIAAAQAFSGDGSRWTHVAMVLDDLACIEAEPGGAQINPIEKYLGMEEVVFCDRPVQDWLAGVEASKPEGLQLTDPDAYWGTLERMKRGQITLVARALKGTRYGYLQYVYMGLLALAGKDGSLDQPRGWFTRWLAKRITQRGSMICSQLADETLLRCGIQVFDDHRLPQNVTPGDLAIRYGVA